MTHEPNLLDVKIKRVGAAIYTGDSDLAGWPGYGTPQSAGLDLVACIHTPVVLRPGEVELIPTGIAIHIDNPNVVAMIYPRGGQGHKNGLVLGNGTGVVDADYQGEVFVSALNRNLTKKITIKPGDKIAQMVLQPIYRANFEVVDEFDGVTTRGEGCLSSTGINVSDDLFDLSETASDSPKVV